MPVTRSCAASYVVTAVAGDPLGMACSVLYERPSPSKVVVEESVNAAVIGRLRVTVMGNTFGLVTSE